MMKESKCLLWVYAADIISRERLDYDRMRELTGFSVTPAQRPGPALVDVWIDGKRRFIGTENHLDPLLCGMNEAGVDILGRFVANGKPGLCIRRRSDWTSVWSGAPFVPADILRWFADAAGAHIYCRNGSQIIDDNGLLTIHAAFDGEHVIALPAPAYIEDAYTGEMVGMTSKMRVKLRQGETRTWKVISDRKMISGADEK